VKVLVAGVPQPARWTEMRAGEAMPAVRCTLRLDLGWAGNSLAWALDGHSHAPLLHVRLRAWPHA